MENGFDCFYKGERDQLLAQVKYLKRHILLHRRRENGESDPKKLDNELKELAVESNPFGEEELIRIVRSILFVQDTL